MARRPTMSFDDLHSTATATADVELDVKLLASLVNVDESEDIHADDSELLARLESADTMASGLEARLDEILGTLDDLLTSLESKDGDSDAPQQVTSESHSECTPTEQP